MIYFIVKIAPRLVWGMTNAKKDTQGCYASNVILLKDIYKKDKTVQNVIVPPKLLYPLQPYSYFPFLYC